MLLASSRCTTGAVRIAAMVLAGAASDAGVEPSCAASDASLPERGTVMAQSRTVPTSPHRWFHARAANPSRLPTGGGIRRTVEVVPEPANLLSEFAAWVAASCRPGASVLEVGAGRARFGYPRVIAAIAGRLVGVDPDPALRRNPYLTECHQSTLEEFAARSDGAQFDVVYAVFVLEHVRDPEGFVDACAHLLKPGGRLFAVTPNLLHYFGLTTWLAGRLGVNTLLLRQLKGADVLADHFPVEYRLNTIGTLTKRLGRGGFHTVEFRCCDSSRRFAWYLPDRLSWLTRGYTRLVYAVGAPRGMGLITVCATR